MNNLIFPRALMIAAKTFASKPAVVGEVLVALVTDADDSCVRGGTHATKLSDVQKYILAECRAELAERQAARVDAAERKRRWRNGKTLSLKGVK